MKDYTCKCCNKKWIDKTHYNIHLNTKKNTGQPRKTRTHKKPLIKWNCKLCNKDFGCKNDIRRHCLSYFSTHAIYANEELGLDVYKDGYSADGVSIEELMANAKEDPDYILAEFMGDNYDKSEDLFNYITELYTD